MFRFEGEQIRRLKPCIGGIDAAVIAVQFIQPLARLPALHASEKQLAQGIGAALKQLAIPMVK